MQGELYFDGSCIRNGQPTALATFGWLLLRDGQVTLAGQGVAARGQGATNNTAEYHALIEGLRSIQSCDLDALEIRSDCQLVIRQLTGEYRVGAPHLVPLYDRAMEGIENLEARGCTVALRWVPRHENTEADALAKEAMQEAREAEATDGYTGSGDPVARAPRRNSGG